jgi:segregation and condensation protein B
MTAENASTKESVTETAGHLRMMEALLFAATEPLDEASLSARLPDGADVPVLLEELVGHYTNRGVTLVRVAGKWALRTAPDLHFLLQEHRQQTRKLSRAGLETLAITAYHQPVTRAEIEEVRGVSLSKGTLDLLMELGWVRIRGRRRTPGRPVTYGTTEGFLEHFGFQNIKDLPGIDELRASGLLEGQVRTDLLPLSHREPEDALEEGDDGSVAILPEDDEDTGDNPAQTAEIIDLQS